MNLNQLAVFVRVVDCGSFTKAARLLHQPKSRVSRGIATLEKALQAPLLYRSTRQFSLTDTGRRLYEQVRHHVYEMEKAAEQVHGDSEVVAGTIRVTAPEDIGSLLMAPVIAELMDKHPQLSVELLVNNAVVDLVKEGLDIGIRIGSLTDKTLKARRLGQITMILVASPDYLKRSPRLNRLEDMNAHAALSFSPTTETKEWRLVSNGREQVVKVNARTNSSHPKLILDLALAGKGIALLPEFICIDAIEQGRLVRVLHNYSTRSVPVQMVWPGQRESSKKMRTFVSVTLEKLSRYFS